MIQSLKDWICSHRGHKWDGKFRSSAVGAYEVQKCRRCGVVSFKDRI